MPKPELSEEERAALHNITSALCNRKQVKDVIEQAVMGTCIALRVPMPDKKNKGKGKEKENGKEKKEKEEKKSSAGKSKTSKSGKEERSHDEEDLDSLADDESDDPEEAGLKRLPLLRRKAERIEGEEDLESHAGSESAESAEFKGFSDSEAEEHMFSKYDGLVGGSSDDDDEDATCARSLRRSAPDGISLSSEASDSEQEDEDDEDDDDSDSSEDSALTRPTKKVKAVKPASFTTGNSAFLPSLMGGYVSGSESASDVDVAPSAKKNRRGQRARQAIWEKKYGEKAKHHQNQNKKDARNAGWDMKRGAVEDTSAFRPWKKGIVNPFEKNNVHPERQRQMQREGNGGEGGGLRKGGRARDARDARDRGPPRQQHQDRAQSVREEKPKPKPPPKRDDTGPLHPSWAAAKKAKENVQKVEFKGTKVTFD